MAHASNIENCHVYLMVIVYAVIMKKLCPVCKKILNDI